MIFPVLPVALPLDGQGRGCFREKRPAKIAIFHIQADGLPSIPPGRGRRALVGKIAIFEDFAILREPD